MIHLFIAGLACGAAPFIILWRLASWREEQWKAIAKDAMEQGTRANQSCWELLAAFDTLKNLYTQRLFKEWEEEDSADWWKQG